MKLSLAWIFDHIDARWQDQDVAALMAKFNQVTAEIEHFYPVKHEMDRYFLATCSDTSKPTEFFIPELQQSISMAARSDFAIAQAGAGEVVAVMLVKKGAFFAWVTLADFGLDRDGLFPPVSVAEGMLTGDWRTLVQAEDVVLDVDNKSITHRPDMWGHRGFAREIAAFLKLPLLPAGQFLKKHPVKRFASTAEATTSSPFTVRNEAPDVCKKFNGLYIPSITNKASGLFMASRLLNVGQRPINMLVDLTNYVTFDWSQPVHAYDAAAVEGNALIVRRAKPGEKLMLLDDNHIELTPQDLVIANDVEPMCLAGVKGGKQFSVNDRTSALYFESACFDAGSVRRSALRHKTRTDSSTRFEKTLDPYQAEEAVLRFLALADQEKVALNPAEYSVSVGVDEMPKEILITHEFLAARSGMHFTQQEIIGLLQALELVVTIEAEAPLTYRVRVPSFRASKDIKIKEDILEEVTRSYGYVNVIPTLPVIYRRPFDLTPLRRMRKLKHFLSDKAGMTEFQNYSLYDEQALEQMGLQEPSYVSVVNPVSEHYQRMISSLLPTLFKNIKENHVQRDSLSIFECARVWKSVGNNSAITEQKSLAGVFFEKRKGVDFYACKEILIQLFKAVEWDTSCVRFEKVENPSSSYYKPYQTMAVYLQDTLIGYAGKAEPVFLSKLDILPTNDAFIFELDVTNLLTQSLPVKRFVPFSRFQDTSFDLSLMVPLAITAASCDAVLKAVSPLVEKIELLDFFEKEEWHNKRSLTFRVWLSHHERTLTKTEIEEVWQAATRAVQACGAELRV